MNYSRHTIILLITLFSGSTALPMMPKKTAVQVAVQAVGDDHPMIQAVRGGDLKTVKSLRKKEKMPINLVNPQGLSLMMIAAFEGHEEVLQFLIKEDAALINYVHPTDNFTVQELAVMRVQQFKSIERLLNDKAAGSSSQNKNSKK